MATMTGRPQKQASEALAGAFGFNPEESVTHFLVNIPRGSQQPVDISEHLSWDPERISVSAHYSSDREDGQVRVRLARPKWNQISDIVRAEFNARLKKIGRKPGRWKVGSNLLVRPLGKELTLLAWSVEDADPALVPNAIANWLGLAAEERWWLYTMTAASAGNAITDRSKGWRKAVRFALAESQAQGRVRHEPTIPEFFRLASEPSLFGDLTDQAKGGDEMGSLGQGTLFQDSETREKR